VKEDRGRVAHWIDHVELQHRAGAGDATGLAKSAILPTTTTTMALLPLLW
jgi:hypothetical protein